ncbi:LysR family transcriptional regulator [Paenibacillus pini]|uniref:Transcriptional regulator n=1 Tax=Paenibacillus pini JCM 16418 TaxID=1236976 RepID=W7Z1S0_9BACL|nr:LysR family transcriptional regulator [Paenibacillus pini]GAF08344.1 transcriptional regulator [Paenibacillus pini JCM 16418]
MELLQLRYFQTVARTEHVTKASEELHISQPSLSKTISRLEADLGVPLFDRHGRQLQLNSYGKAFLERVDHIFMELQEGRRELQDLASLDRGSISLAVSIPKLLPDLLGSFLREFPNVSFHQRIESTSSMKRLLENGEVDFCITSLPIEGNELEWQSLMTEEIYLLTPPEHSLAKREAIRLIEAKDEAFIGMNAGYGFRDLTDEFCKEAGFTPNIAFEGDDPETIGGLVKQGLGIAFIPALSIQQSTRPTLARLKITEPNCQRTIGLSWSNRHYLSLAAQSFQKHVIQYFAKLAL